ncbi:MAG: hypothetical protein FK732_13020 [Asgard group archaeon]|nr:hypothetical protein [Asgard group archaeon]
MNKDIASRLGRSIAGIKNLRYRLNLKTNTKTSVRTLLERREVLEEQVYDLSSEKKRLGEEFESLKDEEQKIRATLFSARNVERK